MIFTSSSHTIPDPRAESVTAPTRARRASTPHPFQPGLPGHGKLLAVPKSLSDIDWNNWQPVDRATLCFIIRAGEILLIRKKRGLGAGKINGPGGRIEPGEAIHECAVREVQEEVGVTPTGLSACGELRFHFVDGYSIQVHVFTAKDCVGEVYETDEAIPLWTPVDAIPYAEMWEDDIIWIPWMLDGRRFSGRFLFDDDRMLGHESGILGVPVDPIPDAPAPTQKNVS